MIYFFAFTSRGMRVSLLKFALACDANWLKLTQWLSSKRRVFLTAAIWLHPQETRGRGLKVDYEGGLCFFWNECFKHHKKPSKVIEPSMWISTALFGCLGHTICQSNLKSKYNPLIQWNLPCKSSKGFWKANLLDETLKGPVSSNYEVSTLIDQEGE